VWRDCKEEGERFENQLASVVEKLSRGKISGEDLAKQSATAVVEILFDFIEDSRVLFVFDNVDHYVDLETGRLAGSPHIFVEALIKSPSKARAIFTCRPSIFFQHSRVLNLPLSGIDLSSTLKLFSERGATSRADEIEDAHKLTVGHAFWLDLLAIQVAKPGSPTDLPKLVAQIRAGKGPLPENTLSSIWSTLKERERTVLRAMAETLKPETEAEIGEYLRREVNYRKVIRALTALRGLNLVVVKRRAKAKDVLELHPMVRQFVWQRFTPPERFSFINAIIAVYTRHIGSHKLQLALRPSLSILQYWTQNAELDINAGKMEEAFLALSDVAEAFLSSAYPREFSRAARLLLSANDWAKEHHTFKNFEIVFRTHVRLLAYLGEYSEVDDLLEKYETTVPHKDARYINFCEMRCFFEWVREDFTASVKWGRMGKSLKLSGVDTQYDVSHSLALAERDSGLPDSALPVFLEGRSLAEVVDPDELEEQRNGPHYGNVGRCLHLMGQIDTALSCYQKSALLLEKTPNQFHVINQGFIRAWIGELLVAREQFKLAEVFLRAAHHKWKNVYPPKAAAVLQLARQVRKRIPASNGIDDSKVEKICLDWIVGRNLDASFT
jgi:tetratricopeptide (TPR) repeat protein